MTFFFSLGVVSLPFFGPCPSGLISLFSFVLVMALQRTAVFKLGCFPPDFSRDDIAKAFHDEFVDRYTVYSIQFVPGGVVKVYFNSSEAKRAVCSQKVMMIGTVECEVLNFSQRSTLVQVHHYPAEADDDELAVVLKDFGDVVGIRSQHWVGLKTITTGTRLCEMKLARDIPRNLRMERMRLKVWYKGQPLECDICKGGHKASECDLRVKCRLCKSIGHFARDCPTPWGRPATNQGVGPAPAVAFAPVSASSPVPAPAPSMEVDSPAVDEVDESASQSILQGVSAVVSSDSNSNGISNESNVSNGSNIVSANVCHDHDQLRNNDSNANAFNINKSNNVSTSANACNDISVSNTSACSGSNLSIEPACNINGNDSAACSVVVHDEIVEAGWASSVPDSVISQISPEVGIILSCVEDGQVVNSPLVSHSDKCTVSDDSSDLDSLGSDWKRPLPKRPSRASKEPVVVVDRRRCASASPLRSRSPVAKARVRGMHAMPPYVGPPRPAKK